MIRAHLKSKVTVATRGRKKKSQVLRYTPVKVRIEQEVAERQDKKKMKEERQKMKIALKNKKATSVKKKLKLSVSSDEEDEEHLEWQESSSDSDFQMEELCEDEYFTEPIEIGDFALIKVSGKNDTYFYAAEVVGKLLDNHYEVKYCKRVDGTFKFVTGDETIFIALEDDIELKLPSPTTSGGTARTLQQMSFNVDLTTYSKKLK